MPTLPLWTPPNQRCLQSHMHAFMRELQNTHAPSIDDYSDLYQWSIDHLATFWQAVWDYTNIRAHTPAHTVIEQSHRLQDTRWFVGATLNYAEQCLRHNPESLAIDGLHENGTRTTFTYGELSQQVAAVSYQLREWGIQPGDVIVGILGDTAETIIAMLACASVGAIWSGVSPDIGEQGILERYSLIQPRVLFTVTTHHYGGKVFHHCDKIERIIQQLPSLIHVVQVPYLQTTHPLTASITVTPWEEVLSQPHPKAITFTPVAFDAPLYLLFSSGTTGKPKCMVHGVGGTLIQHLKEIMLHCDCHTNDKLFFYTTCSWMMWHWKVSTLAAGACVVLYEGSPTYPSTQALWDLMEQLDVTIAGMGAPLIQRYLKDEITPSNTHNLGALNTLLTSASPLTPECFDYLYQHVKQDLCVSSMSGGSDIISCFVLGNPLLPVYRGEIQCRGLGMAVEVMDAQGKSVIDQTGELVCTQAFPSMPVRFWNDPDGALYHQAYFDTFPNIWCHGDFAKITPHQGVIIDGRSDATLNPNGVRIGTADIYQQLDQYHDIQEALAVSYLEHEQESIWLFLQMKPDCELSDTLINTIKADIKQQLSPHHVPKRITQAPDLPRTFNGKIVELVVKRILHHQPVNHTAALANPDSLSFFTQLVDHRIPPATRE